MKAPKTLRSRWARASRTCLVGGALLLTSPAWAGTAEQAVKTMHQAAVRDDLDTLDRFVDYQAVAESALAEAWPTLDGAERNTFVESFRTLVRRAYTRGLAGKEKAPLRFTGETAEGAEHVVHTLVTVKAGQPDLQIDYRMRCVDAPCKLSDVVTDGNSLVDAWKRMFRRIIKKEGKAGLLERIAKKAAEPEE